MKKVRLIIMFIILIASFSLTAQVSISNDNSPPHPSAILDVKSQTAGVLMPRMTQTQREAITSPAAGLLVYQTTEPSGYYYFDGTNWIGITSNSTCIDFDGNTYPTFTIGTQVWMAENLRVTHYRNGHAIPLVTDNAAWEATINGAYCWYDNDQSANAKYGTLYNWYAVNDSRGLCPQGWHVPTDEEWTTLTSHLGGTDVAGGKMKSVSALWESPNANATNNSGFSGLPGGWRYDFGGFINDGWSGHWWSSTEYSSNRAWYRSLVKDGGGVGVYWDWKSDGYSVRCLLD